MKYKEERKEGLSSRWEHTSDQCFTVFFKHMFLLSLCIFAICKQLFIYFSNLSSGEKWAGQAGSEQRTSVVRIKIYRATTVACCTFNRILTTTLGLCKSVAALK